MASYHDLEVWQRGIRIVEEIYSITDTFPQRERFRLVDQMCRSAISIPSNVAEGSAKKSTRDFMRFITIALGSLAELRTQLYIANNLGYVIAEDFKAIEETCISEGKQLQSLYSSLQQKI